MKNQDTSGCILICWFICRIIGILQETYVLWKERYNYFSLYIYYCRATNYIHTNTNSLIDWQPSHINWIVYILYVQVYTQFLPNQCRFLLSEHCPLLPCLLIIVFNQPTKKCCINYHNSHCWFASIMCLFLLAEWTSG